MEQSVRTAVTALSEGRIKDEKLLAASDLRGSSVRHRQNKLMAMLIHTLPTPVTLLIDNHHLHIIGRITAKLFLEVEKGD
jgi:hypothetical protein